MNLNAIHLEVIKGPTIGYMIVGLILSLIFIGFFSYFAIRAFHEDTGVLGIFLLIIAIALSINTIITIPKDLEKYKAGDAYKVYLNDKEDAKTITKENYDFIKNVKQKAILGDKPTEDEVNRIKTIILTKQKKGF
mgnify:CR=1 FL=1